ncbi:MAG: hypothetical protein AB7O91_09495 [Sphingomonas sp.]
MQSSHVMIIMIVLIVMIASVFRAKYSVGKDRHGNPLPPAGNPAELARLRDEVTQLRERLQVLERITVEKENSLAREIEDLRHR